LTTAREDAAQPLRLRHLLLRNRIVGTAHGRGLLQDGLALAGDAEYWGRVAAGGAAMVTVGGTVTAVESTWRRRIVTEAWREAAIPGMALRAEAIRAEGAVAACQLVHLGRETTGAEMWRAPVAPSAVRSPREPTRPRALTDSEFDEVVDGFRVSAVNAGRAGFQVVELHAAHGYLLAQFLSAATNRRCDATTTRGRARIVAAIRRAAPELVLGIRLSTGGELEAGFTLDGICDVLAVVAELADYVNLTVGVRTTYVRDMATTEPPLLDAIGQVRAVIDRPLLVSQAFRRRESIEAALTAGADLVGVARPLIADPDFPAKVLAGRSADVRPCVSCNEDCRAFDPVLLCSVNPDLGPGTAGPRPAAPLLVRRTRTSKPRSVAIVGAGPAGLECAISIATDCSVVLFDEREEIGGHLRDAGRAPNRSGWNALLEYYRHALDAADNVDVRLATRACADLLGGFDHIVMAHGSVEVLPELAGIRRALRASSFVADGASPAAGRSLLIIDDGFGWWPCASAVETGVASGFDTITVLTPAPAFGSRLPPEGHVQLLARLRGAPVDVRPLMIVESVAEAAVTARNVLSGAIAEFRADVLVVVGERRSRQWEELVPAGPAVQVVGDAVVPRRVQHAIAEGRAAAAFFAARDGVSQTPS
jgi:2,4-dienoyl-CoA reductase-like NADH-dependent reductase (Old Yellow Enzyme family)